MVRGSQIIESKAPINLMVLRCRGVRSAAPPFRQESKIAMNPLPP